MTTDLVQRAVFVAAYKGSLMICAAYNHRGMDPKLVKFKSLCEAINTEIVERHKRILPEGDSTNRSISE